ncbi:efflux RND transporter periplasmic adaptor subunit [Thiocapsa bogorovii]|uniref:efflux RND transporter periplasmic adaptor subunit n=1 Tax=Thiocapsa bogorovii TaxID=521689 RepID=UPI001E4069C9|nr:efflux RND transporter periplasmic adaptor subunit [Thiocapsa bogorovii]UHD16160.1 efflux RND transporter periplasmic adaptor subunit [Thiocapsa bogorovii]
MRFFRLTASAACLLIAALEGVAAADISEPALVTAVPAMREIALVGFTRALAEAPLVAETDGRVQALFADVGDRIDESGRFAQLDTTFLELDLEEVGVQEERLRSQIEYDQREVTRFRELVRQNSASASQLDTLEQSLRDNSHALRALNVKRRMLEERLARATISAPVGWSVTARSIELGQWVRGGETVGRAADFSTLLVPFALTPEQFAALEQTRSDLALEILDVGNTAGDSTRARIYRVNPGFDPETRKIAVELALTEPLEPARGGLRMRLRLSLPEVTGAVSLPPSALDSSYEESWVIRESGERISALTLGPDALNPDLIRVKATGLKPGDRVRVFGSR